MIPGVATVHARSAWVDPRFPITGPAANWPAIDVAAIHYTGADDLIDGDPGEHAENLPAYFRAMQRNYVTSRGYSLGYWWGVDWLGGAWQIRGHEFQSAANAGHNGHTGPILVLVDGNDPATDEAAHTIRCIVAEGQRRAARSWAIKGHGQLRRETGIGTATACCGIGLQAQVDAGVFVPRPTITTIPPTTDEVDMADIKYIATPPKNRTGNPPWMIVSDGATSYAANESVRQAQAKGWPLVEQNDEQYDNLLKSAGLA